MKNLLFLLMFVPNLSASAQLTNGSTAPDFTLTDYYGTTHNLYAYLNSGKTVFVEIFAAHCSSCWSYHQTHRLKNIYNQYGPAGTGELMVLALEHDQWNDNNAFIGNGPVWVTQGNWLNGTPYPIFDVEDPDRGVFTDYNVTSYPVVYKICPDKIVERVQTSETEAQLYQKVHGCQAVSIEEHLDLGNILHTDFLPSGIIPVALDLAKPRITAVWINRLFGVVVIVNLATQCDYDRQCSKKDPAGHFGHAEPNLSAVSPGHQPIR